MPKRKVAHIARSPKDCVAHDFMERTLKHARKFSRHDYEDLAQTAFVDALQYAPHMMLIPWSGLHTRMVQQSFIRALKMSNDNFRRIAYEQLYFDFMPTASDAFEIRARVRSLFDALDAILRILSDNETVEREIIRLIQHGVEDFYLWHGSGVVRACHIAKYIDVSKYKMNRAVKSLRRKLRQLERG